jgi:hypothetical protein
MHCVVGPVLRVPSPLHGRFGRQADLQPGVFSTAVSHYNGGQQHNAISGFTSLWIFFSLLLVPFLAPCLGTPMTATNHWILCLVFALVLLVLHLVDQV